jgi:hypothetical protein
VTCRHKCEYAFEKDCEGIIEAHDCRMACSTVAGSCENWAVTPGSIKC